MLKKERTNINIIKIFPIHAYNEFELIRTSKTVASDTTSDKKKLKKKKNCHKQKRLLKFSRRKAVE